MKHVRHVSLFLLVILCLRVETQTPKTTVWIGAVYQGEARVARRAVRLAIARINTENPKMTFIVRERNVTNDARIKSCVLAQMGVTSLIGVVDDVSTDFTLRFVSDELHLPLLQVRPTQYRRFLNEYLYSPLPSESLLLKALTYYKKQNAMNNYIIVYEIGDAMANTAQSFTYQHADVTTSHQPVGETLLIKIEPDAGGGVEDVTLSNLASQIKHMISRRRNDFIKLESIVTFARANVTRSLMDYICIKEFHSHLHWIVVSSDIVPGDLDLMKRYKLCTITIMRQFLSRSSPMVERFVQSWNENVIRDCPNCSTQKLDPNDIPLQAYHIADGIQHLSDTLMSMQDERDYVAAARLNCESGSSWRGGKKMMKWMKKINTTGMLANVGLNKKGYNELSSFEFITKRDGVNKEFKTEILWNINSTENMNTMKANKIHNANFRVVTVLEAPFVMKEKNGVNFTGFSIEIFQKLAQKYGFQYSIYPVPDGKYGSMLKNNSWNGMIGELISDKADIAVSAMTITADRENVIDFAKRYMDYSVGIVIRRPFPSSSLFSFVKPFHSSVWYCIALCLVLVVVIVYFLNQISPSRTTNFNKRDPRNEFDSVFWYAYSCLMQQGSELRTTSFSTRVAVGFWWLFTLIVVSSYTANLAAFLTVQRLDLPIRSFKDLVKQNEIAYGTIPDTSIFDYIMAKGQESSNENSQFKKMSYVINSKSNRVANVRAGFERAEKENLAFLWDVAVIEYEVLTHKTCSIIMVGDSIYDKGYGFALQHDNPFRDIFTQGILGLQESGEIEELRQKYWPKSGRCNLNQDEATTKVAGRTLENFTGIFFVLVGGLVLACLVAVVEIVVNYVRGRSVKSVKKTKISTRVDEVNAQHYGSDNPTHVRHREDEVKELQPSKSDKNTRKVAVLNKRTAKKQSRIPKKNSKKNCILAKKTGSFKSKIPKVDMKNAKDSCKAVDRIPEDDFIKDMDSMSVACVQENNQADLFQYEALNCSPKRRINASFPSAFSTVPRVNLSFSLEESMRTPPVQFHTVSRSHFLRDLEPMPPLQTTRQEWLLDREAHSYQYEDDHNEKINAFQHFSLSDDTPPLLKKSAV